jgi:hypothetical protein
MSIAAHFIAESGYFAKGGKMGAQLLFHLTSRRKGD